MYRVYLLDCPNRRAQVELREFKDAAPEDFVVETISRQDLATISATPEGRNALVVALHGVDLNDIESEFPGSGSNVLVACWGGPWPAGIGEFYSAHQAADEVFIWSRSVWAKLGRLPRTVPLDALTRFDVDLETFIPTHRDAKVLLWRGEKLEAGVSDIVPLDPVANALRSLGMRVEIGSVEDLSSRCDEQIREWLSSYAVLVWLAPDAEGIGILFDAAACGCALVMTKPLKPVGLFRNGVNAIVSAANPDDLSNAVSAAYSAAARLTDRMSSDLSAYCRNRRNRAIFQRLRAIGENPKKLSREARPTVVEDYSDRVTVFVATVGSPSFNACMQHLALQDCTFRLQVIENQAPMSAAFQSMLDVCQTDFFVQVDEDMLLYPDAIRKLCQQMISAKPNVVMVVAYLLDAHLDALIQGVKIFRHSVVQKYAYDDHASFELTQLDRMKGDGYHHEVFPLHDVNPGSVPDPGVLGLHGAHWTPLSVYERYWTLEHKRQEFPKNQAWLESWPERFLRRFLRDGTELDFFALMGIVAARSQGPIPSCSKDYRDYLKIPGFEDASKFFETVKQSRPMDES